MSNRFSDSLKALENNTLSASVQPAAPDKQLLSGVIAKIPPKKIRGVSQTFYLSKEVTEAVKFEAKRKGIAKSNLVDEVLKQVLLASTES